jgi:hypothetical protein
MMLIPAIAMFSKGKSQQQFSQRVLAFLTHP